MKNIYAKNIECMMMSFLVISCVMTFSTSITYGQTATTQLPPVDEKTQTLIIDSACVALNEYYVFPDVAKNMEKLVRANLKSGKYKNITNVSEFSERLTSDLQSVSHDKHLRVRPAPPRSAADAPSVSPEEEQRRQLERYRRANYAFKKVEILPGNIGYIDFRNFVETSFGEAAATAIAAMNFLAYVDAIIFDMRQNGGGSPSMIQLISSYLFDEPVHLNSFYIRKTDEMQQFWTQGHVQGRKMTDIPVFVLTSGFTFSGAEEFTYNLKNLKRGTIIGETTGGGAHPVQGHTFENLPVLISVPYGRAINPITKTNWEGTGVEPDIKVPADQALTVARTEALKKLSEKETDPSRKSEIEWQLKALEVERNPVRLDESELRNYAGDFGPRKILFENGGLYYQREGRPKYRLIPMGGDMFGCEGMDSFRIKFNRDGAGEITELVGLYSEGMTDSNPKTK